MWLLRLVSHVAASLRGMRGAHQGDRGDGTEGVEEGKGEGGKRGGGGEILVVGSTRGLRGPINTKERVALEKKLYHV